VIQLRKTSILLFQLLLLSSLLSGIAAALVLGLLAAAALSTIFCILSVWYYSREFGFDYRAVVLAGLFYLLSWFFFLVKFFPTALSIELIPIVSLGLLSLLLGFKIFFYNKRGVGRVVGQADGYVLVEIQESPWHSLSGVHAIPGSRPAILRAKVKLVLSPGLFSTPQVARIQEAP